MADKPETEVLEVGVDIKTALYEMAKWQRETVRYLETISKASDKMGESVKKVNKESSKSSEEWRKEVEGLTGAYKQEIREIERLSGTIDALKKRSDSASKEDRSNIEEQIELLRQQRKEKLAALKIKGDNYKMYKQEAADAKDAFVDAFRTLFSKDIKGLAAAVPKALAKGLKVMPAAGLRLKEVGAGMAGRGAERGGMVGAGMQGMGSAMKSLGGLMRGIKPLLDMVTKIGPLLGMVGGAILGLVKLFIDLDAKVKAFNKDILQSAGNAEFLAAAGGNAGMAFKDMETTLRGLRDAANEWDNVKWGITPDEHKAVINVLTQEGIALKSIGKQGGQSAEQIKAFASELTHVSIAYSRAFGVPLQEINQLQAEMAQEMGISLDTTSLAFERIQKAATETGVSANKFFAQIRAASQDLSLWGNRMDDAVTLIGKLNKVMSPRTAQNFFNTIQKGFKGMSRTDLLQTALLAGPDKVMRYTQSEVSRNIQKIAGDIGTALKFDSAGIENLAEQIRVSGKSAVEPLLKDLPDEMRGSVSQALTQMELMQNRAKKGLYGLGEAMSDFSPAAAAQVRRDMIMRFAGGSKNMREAAGSIGAGAMAERAGVSVEEFNHYAKLEGLFEDQISLLKDKMLDPEMQKKMARAGIKGTAEGIENASWGQLMETMSLEQQALVEGADKTQQLAAKQADLQTDLLQRIDQIFNFLTNQLYNVIKGIWDTILDLPLFGSDSKRKAKLAQEAPGDIVQAVDADDPSKAILRSESWKSLMESLRKTSVDSSKRGDFDKAVKAMAKELGPGNIFSAAKMADIDPSKLARFYEASRGRGRDPIQEMLKVFSPEEITRIMEKATVWTGSGISKAESVNAGLKALGISPFGGGSATPASSVTRTPTSPAATANATVEQRDLSKDSLKMSREQLQTIQSVDNQLDRLKMDTGFVNGPYSKAVESSVLAAFRTALFEYYMYKDMDQGDMVKALHEGGGSVRSFSQRFSEAALSGKTGEEFLLQPNASGGIVTGVRDGIARVTAAAGEGLASVGPGERIVPRGEAGVSGNTFNIRVDGVGGQDLARVIQAKVIDGIYEYKRRERFT